MQAKILEQPEDVRIGDLINEQLRHTGRFSRVILLVAFAKASGIAHIEDMLVQFKNKPGTRIDICVGVDHDGTSREALELLFQLSDNLFIVHSTRLDVTFHSKVYFFTGSVDARAIIGSSNLTAGGLLTNIETAVLL
jgi:HKD family nuclease